MEQGGQVGMARGTTVGVVSGDCSLGVNYWSSCDSLCLMGILLACSPPTFYSVKNVFQVKKWVTTMNGFIVPMDLHSMLAYVSVSPLLPVSLLPFFPAFWKQVSSVRLVHS